MPSLVVRVCSCLALVAAPASVFAQAAAPSPIARVVAVHANVDVRGPDERSWHPLNAGTSLGRGARVRAGEHGIARLALPNGSSLTVLPGATVVLFSDGTELTPTHTPSTATTLDLGTVRVTAAPEGARVLPLATGATSVDIGRGEAVVSTVRSHSLVRVSTLAGRMHIRTGAVAHTLRAGAGSRERLRPTAAPEEPLPAAPVWRERPTPRVACLLDVGEATATWSAGDNTRVAGWRVETARDASFDDVLTSERLGAAQTRWTGRVQGAGDWYVRVAAVDANGYEGPFGAPARFTLEAPRIEPGTSTRPASVLAPAGIWCGLDGARMVPLDGALVLPPGRAHTVRCARNGEGETRTLTVSAEESGALRHEVTLGGEAMTERVLSVRLWDLAGRPLPYLTLTAETDEGVEIDPLREAPERGVYVAPVRWRGARERLRVTVTVNRGVRFTDEVVVRQRP